MSKFAKVFEMPDGGQVVIIKKWSEDDQANTLSQETHVGSCSIVVAIGFDSELKRDDSFEKYNDKVAQSFYKGIKELMED